jgi:hypothetical protein
MIKINQISSKLIAQVKNPSKKLINIQWTALNTNVLNFLMVTTYIYQ